MASALPSLKNYCRNPDDDGRGPWCFTDHVTDQMEYCDIPRCGTAFTHSPVISVFPQRVVSFIYLHSILADTPLRRISTTNPKPDTNPNPKP